MSFDSFVDWYDDNIGWVFLMWILLIILVIVIAILVDVAIANKIYGDSRCVWADCIIIK